MLEYGLSLALISSALDEVRQDSGLLKTAAATDPGARELLDYLSAHGEELHKWSTELFQAWYCGFEKRAAKDNIKPDELIKQAVLGLDLPLWAEIPASLGYLIPGVGTAMFGADAARHFYKMFGKDLNWKQRLAQGLYGALNTGAAGLSLLPYGGAVSKGLGWLGKLGKPGAWLASKMPTAKSLYTAAGAVKPGIAGRAMRLAGYSPKAKAGWMHKLLNRLRVAAGRPEKAYIRPYARLGAAARGLKVSPGSPYRLRFPWGRYMAAEAPLSLLAGAGGTAGAAAGAAGPGARATRLTRRVPLFRATPRELARWSA